MKRNIFTGMVLLALTLIGCQKEPGITPSNLKDLSVPTEFKWTNSQLTDITVAIVNPKNLVIEGRTMQVLDPQGRTIQQSTVRSGEARFHLETPNTTEALTLYFPMTRDRLEIQNSSSNHNISFNLSANEPIPVKFKSLSTSPSCDEGCTQTFSGNLTNLEIKSEGTYCLTGTLNGGLTISKDATLRICGTANITWTSISSSKTIKIIITSTGSLTSSGFYLEGTKQTLENYGLVKLNNWLNVKTSLINFGIMDVAGMEITKTGTLRNYGTFNSNGETNLSGTLINEDSFTINGGSNNLNITNTGTLSNSCRFTVPRNMNSQGAITNNGYIRVTGFFYGESSGSITLGNQGMLHCTNFQPNCAIICPDADGFGSIKIDAVTNIDAKTKFTGNIDLCDANGIDNNWGATVGKNVTYCEGYIPVTSCNPEGLGTPSVEDADNDGIVDDEDLYPKDPLKAFDLIEPYEGYKLWAFEDLWPSTGDYDFNDIVLATRIVYILGPDQKQVEANGEVIVKAMGAGIKNGIGMQFLGNNISKINLISSVSGPTVSLDPATGNTLIIFKDLMSVLKPFYNNNGSGLKGTPQSFRFTVLFDGSIIPDKSDIYSDFFVFRAADRSLEIHIPDKPATSAAATALFGSQEDATNPSEGYWYKTANGITWGMTLITLDNEWNNPVERVSILQAFPEFREWAVTGGKQNKEWHKKGVYEKCFHF